MDVGGRMDKKLERLKEQQAKLTRQIRGLQAQQKKKERKDDTRRKVLVGALVLNHIVKGEPVTIASFDDLMKQLDAYLVRKTDRAVFELPVRENKEGKALN